MWSNNFPVRILWHYLGYTGIETNETIMYIIAIAGILLAAAGIWFMTYNSGKDRYRRKQLKKLYKRSRLRVVHNSSIKAESLAG